MNEDFAISLKTIGYDLNLAWQYSPNAPLTPYGNQWSCSAGARVLVETDGSGVVAVAQGNGSQYPYNQVGSSGGITTYLSVASSYSPNTLTYDGMEFTEYLAGGGKNVYQQLGAFSSPEVFQLAQQITPYQAIATYTYGSGAEQGLLKSIQVPDGRFVSFAYGVGAIVSLLSTFEDWGGRFWTFTYDPSGDLSQYQTPLGCSYQYNYYTSGAVATLLFSKETPQGFITQYGWTGSQVATMVAGTGVWTWAYGATAGVSGAVMIDPGGGATTWVMNSGGQIDHIALPQYVISYTYDSNGMMLKELHPNGAVLSVAYNAAGQTIVSDDVLGYRTTMMYSVTDGTGTSSRAVRNAGQSAKQFG